MESLLFQSSLHQELLCNQSVTCGILGGKWHTLHIGHTGSSLCAASLANRWVNQPPVLLVWLTGRYLLRVLSLLLATGWHWCSCLEADWTTWAWVFIVRAYIIEENGWELRGIRVCFIPFCFSPSSLDAFAAFCVLFWGLGFLCCLKHLEFFA